MFGQEVKMDDIGMDIDVKIRGLAIDFAMQPVMRLLDVVLTQVMGSLQEDVALLKMTKDDALNMIAELSFMRMRVVLEDTQISVTN